MIKGEIWWATLPSLLWTKPFFTRMVSMLSKSQIQKINKSLKVIFDKEVVCAAWNVSIPPLVEEETVVQSPHRTDAVLIRKNITAGHLQVNLKVSDAGKGNIKGEDAVLSLFNSGGFNAVGTDDARFIRRLRGLRVPYALPAVLLVKLRQEKFMTAQEALVALRPHISADEHTVAYLMLTGGELP